MRRAGNFWATGVSALFACAAFNACSYDFDTLVAQTGPGGSAGTGGSAGQAGSSGAAGSDDDGGGTGGTGMDGSAGTGGAGSGGTSGKGGSAGKSGTDAGPTDAGKGGDTGADAGKAGTDAGSDRIADVRSEPVFDCTAVSGTAFQGRCYYPGPVMTDWDTANRTGCVPPSHLAVITSAAEQNVVAAIHTGKDRWIGLRKDPGSPNMESSFHWVTAEVLGYKVWDTYETGPPEPNYTGECVRMRSTNNWGDTPCTDSYVAVCERE
jgi:hypothetical protein